MNPQNQNTFPPQDGSGTPPQPQPGFSQPVFSPTSTPAQPVMAATPTVPQPPVFSPPQPFSASAPMPNQPFTPSGVPQQIPPTSPSSAQMPGVFGAPQPTPPSPGQPSPNDYYANGAKPGNTLGILSLILAVLVAPAGLVLGIISMVKGFKKNNRTLAFMGLGAVILSPIMMVVGLIIFNQLSNSALEVGSLKEQKMVIGRNTLTAEIPDKLQKGESNAENQQIYTIKGIDKNGKETAAAQFAVSLVENAYGTDDLSIITSTLASPTSQNGKIFIAAVKNSLTDGLKAIGCEDTIMDNPETLKLEGTEFAAKFPFHCDISGRGRYRGYMVDAGDKTDEAIILVGASEDMWNKNVAKFEKTVSSIKLERN